MFMLFLSFVGLPFLIMVAYVVIQSGAHLKFLSDEEKAKKARKAKGE